MAKLIKCTSCARHVRLTETTCPFCSSPLDLAERSSLAAAFDARLPKARLGRAALLAIGLGVVAPITVACGNDDSSDTGDGEDAGHAGSDGGGGADAAPDANLGVLYGAFVGDADVGDDDASDASAIALYGGPFPEPDASLNGDGGDASTVDGGDGGDASTTDGGPDATSG